MRISSRPFPSLVIGLVNAGALADVAGALRDGRLRKESGAATVGGVASGRTGVHTAIRVLLGYWRSDYAELDGRGFAVVIEAIAEGARAEREASPRTEVVWTGPKVEGSYLRATRQVVQDIIQGAQTELLVVGYWIAGKGDQEGIIKDVVELIADAVRRGVLVTMVLDRGEKPYGRNNRAVLLDLWPGDVPAPKLLTWEIPEGERHLKLHAKVLVGDRSDALVTSANLTMYAMDRNIEMGVRVTGSAGERISQHFQLLVNDSVLAPFT